jgi:hypothetical protein
MSIIFCFPGNETSGAEAKRPADAPSASAGIGGGIGGGVGIGLFAKRRAVPAASTAVNSIPSGQSETVKTNSSPHKSNGLTSTASSVANLSHFDTNLLSENKNENEASSSSGNVVQIPKSIATNDGGDVGTTTSVAVVTMGGVVNAAPPAAKSPYFSGAVNQRDIQASNTNNTSISNVADNTAMSKSSPSKEEIIIPGMNVGTEKIGVNADIQGGVVATPNASSSQRVSLSPPGAKMNQAAASNVSENSIVIPGVTNNDNMDVAQTMMQLGGATKGKTHTAVSTANNTQRVNGAFTSSNVLGNNSCGIGRFNSTEKVKFTLPEPTTKTAAMKSTANMNMANTTAITPDHRNGVKQAASTTSTPFARPSASSGKNYQNAVTPTPHKPVTQYDSAPCDIVIPGMPTAEKHYNASSETRTDVELQDRNETMMGDDSVRSPTPMTKNDVSTPRASNLNTAGGGYSGSSMLTTHESFDELLTQLGGDLTDATDLHNKGNLDLLHIEVALTHAYAKALQMKGQYVDLVDEIDALSSMGESIMIELEG